ncbi:hypothetical protein M2103_000676 [Ereboglobus sp. PH5-5]|uniref:hypothetical protein n=1 Tax=unclassified Ereboglobus TaxID=2626932 RepID=UPI0024066DE5|nr:MULTISPECIES: hypothetical protein [unclassified Ereboglobus]MDF9828564.1 hypothetical protein [Ereboglobus sp. PH5-10]MDF9832466.1 hypothetical protein [Ereboglobus sp. PH5-5]
MLDWLLKNPQIVIFLLFGVIALFGRVAQMQKEAKEKRERQMRSGRQPPEQSRSRDDVAEEAERTRRLQEEIRRKILARMDRAQPPQSMPQDSAPPLFPQERQPAATRPPPIPSAPAQPAFSESAGAYQSAMDRLAEMQATSAAASANMEEISASQETNRVTSPAVSEALASLRDTNSLRKAFILRDILDKPVGLR